MRNHANAVFGCVVVGSGRPSPALVIELIDGLDQGNELKHQIARDMRLEQTGLSPHEIIGVDFILFAVAESLPRTTKRTIKRHAVEELYKSELDRLYESAERAANTPKLMVRIALILV